MCRKQTIGIRGSSSSSASATYLLSI